MLGRAVVASCLLACAAPTVAQELKQLQTEDVQLVWFHPTEDYLAPYVARSFENSMDWQKRVFGWKPDGRVNLLLKDFADYGNAGARASPNNALIVDIAPFSFSFETFVATERMYTLMNHELVHVANMDQATEREMRWRRFFGGKVQINPDHPESLYYHYVTTPRDVVPRWWLEGAAVFFETWMSGGMGRAQGAYDEMVFRAMVRDEMHTVISGFGGSVAGDDRRALADALSPGPQARHAAEKLGLGLFVAKRYIELHGGETQLENGPAGRPAFRVTLPAAATEAILIAPVDTEEATAETTSGAPRRQAA